jgi:hypothetical protein
MGILARTARAYILILGAASPPVQFVFSYISAETMTGLITV